MPGEDRREAAAARVPEGPDTKTRILDAAEELFARHGFAATSLRAVTRAAGVNLAAVNYHFGSKEQLTRAVFERRVGPINRERLDQLDALEAEARSTSRSVSLEGVAHAFLIPPLRFARGGEPRCFMRVMARGIFEPDSPLAKKSGRLFGEVFARFSAALREALPGLTPDALNTGFRFMVGALVQTLMMDADPLQNVVRHHAAESAERDEVPDAIPQTAVESHLVRFVSGGLRALAAVPEERRPREGSERA